MDRCCVDTRCFEVQMCRFHAHFFSYRCPNSDYAVLLAKSWLRHSRGIFYFYQSFISVICFHRHDSQTKQRRVLKSVVIFWFSSSCQQFVVDSTGPCCQPWLCQLKANRRALLSPTTSTKYILRISCLGSQIAWLTMLQILRTPHVKVNTCKAIFRNLSLFLLKLSYFLVL